MKAKYRARNNERRREYYREHKAETLAKQKCYVLEHAEEVKAYKKRWAKENRDKVLASKKRSYRRHPETARRDCRIRYARKKGIDEQFSLEMERFVREFWGHRCAVCGRSRRTDEKRAFPIDHWLPLVPADGSEGNPLTMLNAVLLCPEHNLKKNNRYPAQVFDAEIVTEIECLLKRQQTTWDNCENRKVG